MKNGKKLIFIFFVVIVILFIYINKYLGNKSKDVVADEIFDGIQTETKAVAEENAVMENPSAVESDSTDGAAQTEYYENGTWQYQLYHFLLELSADSYIEARSFYLKDFSCDGIPEIVTFHPNAGISLYTYQNGTFEYAMGTTRSWFYSFEKLPIIACEYGPHQGQSSLSYFRISEQGVEGLAGVDEIDMYERGEEIVKTFTVGTEDVEEEFFIKYVKELIGESNYKNEKDIRKISEAYQPFYRTTEEGIRKAIDEYNNGFQIIDEPIKREEAIKSYQNFLNGEGEAVDQFWRLYHPAGLLDERTGRPDIQWWFSLLDLDGDQVEELIVRKKDTDVNHGTYEEIRFFHYFNGKIYLWWGIPDTFFDVTVYDNKYIERKGEYSKYRDEEGDIYHSEFFKYDRYGEWQDGEYIQYDNLFAVINEAGSKYFINYGDEDEVSITRDKYEYYLSQYQGEEVSWQEGTKENINQLSVKKTNFYK